MLSLAAWIGRKRMFAKTGQQTDYFLEMTLTATKSNWVKEDHWRESRLIADNGMRVLRTLFFGLLVALACHCNAQATTWNEPWHKEVVSGATSLGLYEIVDSQPHTVTLKQLKHIAGDDTGATVQLRSFYALRLTSLSSGDKPEFRLPQGRRAYFYLKRVDTGWAIATPTSGYALLNANGKVAATYRFSAHQALIDPQLYETTQRCIFQKLHGVDHCDPTITTFIATELAKPASGIGADETPEGQQEFFRQHAALETAGFIGTSLPDDLLERFLTKSDVHVQISALRALAGSSRSDKADRLMRFVEDNNATMPARVVAVLLLKEVGAHQMKARLQAYASQASEEETGLGMALMDPRIGTWFPSSLKQAVRVVGEQL
jgi:hypothetical protein